MTAFEAEDPQRNLKFPAKNLTWTMTLLYILTTFIFVLNVKWDDCSLPRFYNQDLAGLAGGAYSTTGNSSSTPGNGTSPTDNCQQLISHSAPVIAIIRANIPSLPGFITVCFIYSALSAANTGLYVASRALYGLTRNIRVERDTHWLVRAIAKPGHVHDNTQSPWWALAISVLILCWLPFVHLNGGSTKEEVRLDPSSLQAN